VIGYVVCLFNWHAGKARYTARMLAEIYSCGTIFRVLTRLVLDVWRWPVRHMPAMQSNCAMAVLAAEVADAVANCLYHWRCVKTSVFPADARQT